LAQPASFLPIAGMMFLAGIGIPVMATLNAGLGLKLGSPVAATFVLCVLAVVLAGLAMLATGVPNATSFTLSRPQLYAGALFFLFYALSITWAAPRIGVGNAVFFVLLGQLVAAAAIDHFGWMGAMRAALTSRRLAGLLVMAAGVYLARKQA